MGNMSRRDALASGVAGVAVLGFGPSVFAEELDTDETIAAFVGAENGHSVPIKIFVDSAMTGEDLVEEVVVLASGNPNPGIATFKFSRLSGEARASTRIRLAQTQDIVALARMKDGSIHRTSRAVKVTIGGCGG